ncbi:50S ribosomal protein L6 [Candidatus Woesearchaeota archaeon]|nr:50S ribosomal protein L6 [Candidatus Woesearchaeota archaeon]MCF7901353.1 50S ribosomal protein L6 [Candidatus Woesearchaeota archaeon]MCF8013353.1 50S ribosomal protein L6 [Candidatus Woesearchaeota archaeon]
MAENKELKVEIEIPQDVEIKHEGRNIHVKGPKGEVHRKLADIHMTVEVQKDKMFISYQNNGKKQKAQLFTTRAHIKNMIDGVHKSFNYKLKICSGHFPMNVSLKGDIIEIKNFIGEKVPRTVKIKEGAKVTIKGEIIEVDGINKEIVGQTAADIEKLTKRPGFDKRIFQDGIYIIEKNGKKI